MFKAEQGINTTDRDGVQINFNIQFLADKGKV